MKSLRKFRDKLNQPLPSNSKNPFRVANAAVGAGCVCGCFFWIAALGLTVPLFLIAAGVNLLLGGVSKLVRRFQKGRGFLYVLRGIAVLTVIVFVLVPVTVMNFERTPLLYPAKRFVFTRGVQSKELYREMLPEHLPENCTDYYFRTQGQAITQDYVPSCYLVLHTDPASLEQFLQTVMPQVSYALVQMEQPVWDAENPKPDPAQYTDGSILWAQCPELAGHAASVFWSAGLRDDLTEAELWRTANAAYSKGILINKKTGLFALWT